MKIRTKLFLFTFIVSIVPIILIGYFSYSLGTGIALDSEKKVTQKTLKTLRDELNGMFGETKSSLEYLADKFKESESKGIETVEAFKNSNTNYKSTYYAAEKDGAVKIFPESSKAESDISEVKDQPWYILAINDPPNGYFAAPTTDNQEVISFTKAVIKDGQVMGVVGIDLDISRVAQKIKNTVVGTSGIMYVMDSEGFPLIYPENKKLSISLEEKKKIKAGVNGDLNFKWDGRDVFMYFDTIETLNWKILGGSYKEELYEQFKEIKAFNMIIITITILMAVILQVIFTRNLANGISKLLESAAHLSNGDFSKKITHKRKDELGKVFDSFNDIIHKQGEVISEIKSEMDKMEVMSSISEKLAAESLDSVKIISQSIEEIENGLESNANALLEASISIDEIAHRARSVADISINAGNKVNGAVARAAKGKEGVEKIIDAMREVSQTARVTHKSVEELTKETESIRKLLSDIKGISDQTNLLSLNAAIEAARAGEAGKGFAVVANEVKTLAFQTEQITQRIEVIINSVVKKNKYVNESLEEEGKKLSESNDVMKNVGREIITVIDFVKEIDVLMQEVIHVSESQSASTEEMAAVINSISVTVNNNKKEIELVSVESAKEVEKTEEIKKISEELDSIVKNMDTMIEKFIIEETTMEMETYSLAEGVIDKETAAEIKRKKTFEFYIEDGIQTVNEIENKGISKAE